MKRISLQSVRTPLAVLLVAVTVMVAACAPKATPTPTAAAAPTLTITAPANGASIPAGNVTVTIAATNFSIVNKLSQANVAGEGHIHYFLDVTPPTEPGKPAVTAQGTYAATASTQNVWQNVPAGSHTFYAELINNDHTPLVPPVVAKVTVTLTAATPAASPAAAPTLTITAPKDGATVAAGNVTVTVAAANFSLVNKLSQATVPGEGHIHYFLDVTPPTEPGKPAVTAQGTYAAAADTSHVWANVPAGSHTFYAELINNDHTPLVPPVVAKVTVTVAAAAPAASPAAAPTITITAPVAGAVVAPGSIAVTVSTTNFSVVDKKGGANVAGEGHIHFFLDVTPPTEAGKPAVTAPGTYAAETVPNHTWTNVAAGSHTLYAELVNNDHTPLVPPVVVQVAITTGTAGAAGGTGY